MLGGEDIVMIGQSWSNTFRFRFWCWWNCYDWL